MIPFKQENIPRKLEGKCKMALMMNGPGVPKPGTAGYKVIRDYLKSKNLVLGKGNGLLPSRGDRGSSHVSFVATREAAELLAKRNVFQANFTTKGTAIWCEALLGVIVNRVSRQAGHGDKCAGAVSGWKSKNQRYWIKLHGSGMGGFAHSDSMATADFLRFADVNMDGRIAKAEVIGAIMTNPVVFQQIFYKTCSPHSL